MNQHPELLGELEMLFEHANPEQLQKDIEFVFFKYLMNEEPELLPRHLHKLTSDIYALIEFLHNAKNIKRKEYWMQ